MKQEEIRGFTAGSVVLRSVCGGDTSFWLVPMSGPELEEWWASQESLEYDPDGITKILAKQFNEAPPVVRASPIPGRFIATTSDKENELWDAMRGDREHYFCILCCDQESYLETPTGHRVYHRGRSTKGTPNVLGIDF